MIYNKLKLLLDESTRKNIIIEKIIEKIELELEKKIEALDFSINNKSIKILLKFDRSINIEIQNNINEIKQYFEDNQLCIDIKMNTFDKTIYEINFKLL